MNKEIFGICTVLTECIGRECIDTFIEDENGDLEKIITTSTICIAENLFNNNIRNADEVKKEILKDIYDTVCDVGSLSARDIKYMAKHKYGFDIE